MDIQERAKGYAEGKGLDLLKAAFERAYMDGYEEGYRVAENNNVNEVIEGVEYVDLGLPSGTKWANGYLSNDEPKTIHLTYEEADKLNIPTKDQVDELVSNCKKQHLIYKGTIYGYRMLGKNGNYVSFYNASIITAGISTNAHRPVFWLRNDSVEDLNRSCVDFNNYDYLGSEFMGNKLPVVLVK